MASLLLPDDDPAAPPPLLQLPDERPPSLQPDPRADALGQTYRDITDYMAQQHQKGIDEGYWTGGGLLEGGHPTLKAFNSAADEYAQGLLMGTTSPSGKYLKAYHGSPHQFDAFSNDAIGTGEGAQAYGYGHYLAENEGVARGYRDALTPKFIPNPERKAVENEFSFADTASRKAMTGPEADFNAAIAARDAARERLNNTPELIPNPSAPGHMYEVNVAADPEKFLHWDKPLSEQHPDVQAAINSIGDSSLSLSQRMMDAERLKIPLTGRDVVSSLSRNADYGAEAVAQKLKEAGIPGIRYLDAGSRGAKGEPTHNAVVFDPATMEIIRRYGLAGLMLGGGGLLSPDKQEQ